MTEALPARRPRDSRRPCQRGMTTTEYAVGTVAVVTGVGVLLGLIAGPTAPMKVFWPMVQAVLQFVLRMLGIPVG